jgi:hypothetical protein
MNNLHLHQSFTHRPPIRRYMWRLNHDAWQIAFIILVLLAFVVLDLLRGF